MKSFEFIPIEHARYNYKLSTKPNHFHSQNSFEKKHVTLLHLIIKRIQSSSSSGLPNCVFSTEDLLPHIRRHLFYDVNELNDRNKQLAKEMRTYVYQIQSEEYNACRSKIEQNNKHIREAYEDFFYLLLQYLRLQGYTADVEYHNPFHHDLAPVTFSLHIYWHTPTDSSLPYIANQSDKSIPSTDL